MSRLPASAVDPGLELTSDTGRTYAVLEPLGRGGNASAFLVVGTSESDQGLPSAAKFFTHDDAARRTAFLGEIAYLRNHPHGAILPIYDAGASLQGFPFYVSRYMATTLERIIESERAPMFDKLLYASQLASALGYLASADPQILHRDVNASNVFVNGRTCLLGDFGMMGTLGSGTVDRAVPWEARTPDMVRHLSGGAAPTTQSDVFSLGVVLYRLFTGERPCFGRSGRPTPCGSTISSRPAAGTPPNSTTFSGGCLPTTPPSESRPPSSSNSSRASSRTRPSGVGYEPFRACANAVSLAIRQGGCPGAPSRCSIPRSGGRRSAPRGGRTGRRCARRGWRAPGPSRAGSVPARAGGGRFGFRSGERNLLGEGFRAMKPAL